MQTYSSCSKAPKSLQYFWSALNVPQNFRDSQDVRTSFFYPCSAGAEEIHGWIHAAWTTIVKAIVFTRRKQIPQQGEVSVQLRRLVVPVCESMMQGTFLVRSAVCAWTGSIKWCCCTADGVLQLSQKSGGVKGKKESKVNPTGAEGHGKTRGEDGRWNEDLEIFAYSNFIL